MALLAEDGLIAVLLFISFVGQTLADRTCPSYGRRGFREYVICPDYDGTSAYCCDNDTGEACCYQYEFWYTWYFWCACFVVILIILALLVTCCKAYHAKKRRINTTRVVTTNTRLFDVESPHRQTALPMYDFPPSYDQIRKQQYNEFSKAPSYQEATAYNHRGNPSFPTATAGHSQVGGSPSPSAPPYHQVVREQNSQLQP